VLCGIQLQTKRPHKKKEAKPNKEEEKEEDIKKDTRGQENGTTLHLKAQKKGKTSIGLERRTDTHREL